MQAKEFMDLFAETAYIRTGGSPEEKKMVEFLIETCRKKGMDAHTESFPVDMAEIQTAEFYADGEKIPCKGYFCSGCADLEAPLYYLRDRDPGSLSQCRGKIVLLDGGVSFWTYRDLLENGAAGFVTYSGDVHFGDRDIDQKELRGYVSQGEYIPGVHIHVSSAIDLIRRGVSGAKILLKQTQYEGTSQNAVLDLPGEIPDVILFSAHYDSTPLSQGAYDNMSGCLGILAAAEYFYQHPHRYSLRFVWCGCEERGLLGSKAYCEAHTAELKDVVLNINLDMIGCIMGKFEACCTAEEPLMHYLRYMASELGFGIRVSQGVYPSDSTPFADHGVPAVTFARSAPSCTATIHNRYDTADVMMGEHMQEDAAFITAFADRMANAKFCPVAREIPENMKEKLDIYMSRKRDKNG